MRVCTKCGGENTTKTQDWCSGCKKEYDEKYYTKDRKKEQQKRIRARKQELKQWCRSLKEGKPCVDCGGVFHFSAMDWDHKPEFDKVDIIAVVLNKTSSKKRVLEEIAKCDLRCANCHRVKSFERQHTSVSPTAF